MTSSNSNAPFIVMLSIFSTAELLVLKLAKSRSAIICSASKYVSNAVFVITTSDVVKKICPIIKLVILNFTYLFLPLVENYVHHLLGY